MTDITAYHQTMVAPLGGSALSKYIGIGIGIRIGQAIARANFSDAEVENMYPKGYFDNYIAKEMGWLRDGSV